MKITKDMLIADILKQKPQAIGTLMSFGMGCVMCPASQMESLEEACMVHGMDADIILEALNKEETV